MTQPTNGNEGIESATASAAAILSQLNEMVQGQQHQAQNNHLTGDLLATTDLNRVQSEKVIYISSNLPKNPIVLLQQTADALLAAAISKTNFGTNTAGINSTGDGLYQPTGSGPAYMDIDRPSLAAAALYDLKNEQLQLANAAIERNQQGTSTESKQQDSTGNQSVTTTSGTQQQFNEEGLSRIFRVSIH